MSQTLIGIFLDLVERHPRPDLFLRHTAQGWEPISAERALADVESAGLGLAALGVERGDRLALLSENRYEWPVCDLAALGLGAITVPIYPTLTAAQVRYVLHDCAAKVVVVSTAMQLAKLQEIAPSLPALKAIVHLDRAPAARPQDVSFAALLERGAERRQAEPAAFRGAAASVSASDLATFIYTSGTTGDPKGAMLTHDNIASNVRASLELVDISPADRCLSFLPLCHIFERMAGLYAMLAAGATIAYAQSTETVAADAMETRPTILCGVPRFYEKVHARVMDSRRKMGWLSRTIFDWGLAQGRAQARAHFAGRRLDTLATRLADRLVGNKIRARVGGRQRFGISGGAPLPGDVMEFFFAVGIPLLEGYGLTETSPVITLNPPGHEKPGSVGRPIPGIEVRIGDDGEILTRGPHIMRGYYGNPAATEAALAGGWFHTGDVGRFDDQGYLVITDRLKDLLVTAGGKKVAPQPIEARLKTSPLIAEAVLLGDRRPYVVCLLVPDFAALGAVARSRGWGTDRAEMLGRPEVRALYEAEIARVNAGLARFETIKQFALLDRELTQESGELTPTLKVKRRVIMQRYGALIDDLYDGGTRAVAAAGR